MITNTWKRSKTRGDPGVKIEKGNEALRWAGVIGRA